MCGSHTSYTLLLFFYISETSLFTLVGCKMTTVDPIDVEEKESAVLIDLENIRLSWEKCYRRVFRYTDICWLCELLERRFQTDVGRVVVFMSDPEECEGTIGEEQLYEMRLMYRYLQEDQARSTGVPEKLNTLRTATLAQTAARKQELRNPVAPEWEQSIGVVCTSLPSGQYSAFDVKENTLVVDLTSEDDSDESTCGSPVPEAGFRAPAFGEACESETGVCNDDNASDTVSGTSGRHADGNELLKLIEERVDVIRLPEAAEATSDDSDDNDVEWIVALEPSSCGNHAADVNGSGVSRKAPHVPDSRTAGKREFQSGGHPFVSDVSVPCSVAPCCPEARESQLGDSRSDGHSNSSQDAVEAAKRADRVPEEEPFTRLGVSACLNCEVVVKAYGYKMRGRRRVQRCCDVAIGNEVTKLCFMARYSGIFLFSADSDFEETARSCAEAENYGGVIKYAKPIRILGFSFAFESTVAHQAREAFRKRRTLRMETRTRRLNAASQSMLQSAESASASTLTHIQGDDRSDNVGVSVYFIDYEFPVIRRVLNRSDRPLLTSSYAQPQGNTGAVSTGNPDGPPPQKRGFVDGRHFTTSFETNSSSRQGFRYAQGSLRPLMEPDQKDTFGLHERIPVGKVPPRTDSSVVSQDEEDQAQSDRVDDSNDLSKHWSIQGQSSAQMQHNASQQLKYFLPDHQATYPPVSFSVDNNNHQNLSVTIPSASESYASNLECISRNHQFTVHEDCRATSSDAPYTTIRSQKCNRPNGGVEVGVLNHVPLAETSSADVSSDAPWSSCKPLGLDASAGQCDAFKELTRRRHPVASTSVPAYSDSPDSLLRESADRLCSNRTTVLPHHVYSLGSSFADKPFVAELHSSLPAGDKESSPHVAIPASSFPPVEFFSSRPDILPRTSQAPPTHASAASVTLELGYRQPFPHPSQAPVPSSASSVTSIRDVLGAGVSQASSSHPEHVFASRPIGSVPSFYEASYSESSNNLDSTPPVAASPVVQDEERVLDPQYSQSHSALRSVSTTASDKPWASPHYNALQRSANRDFFAPTLAASSSSALPVCERVFPRPVACQPPNPPTNIQQPNGSSFSLPQSHVSPSEPPFLQHSLTPLSLVNSKPGMSSGLSSLEGPDRLALVSSRAPSTSHWLQTLTAQGPLAPYSTVLPSDSSVEVEAYTALPSPPPRCGPTPPVPSAGESSDIFDGPAASARRVGFSAPSPSDEVASCLSEISSEDEDDDVICISAGSDSCKPDVSGHTEVSVVKRPVPVLTPSMQQCSVMATGTEGSLKYQSEYVRVRPFVNHGAGYSPHEPTWNDVKKTRKRQRPRGLLEGAGGIRSVRPPRLGNSNNQPRRSTPYPQLKASTVPPYFRHLKWKAGQQYDGPSSFAVNQRKLPYRGESQAQMGRPPFPKGVPCVSSSPDYAFPQQPYETTYSSGPRHVRPPPLSYSPIEYSPPLTPSASAPS